MDDVATAESPADGRGVSAACPMTGRRRNWCAGGSFRMNVPIPRHGQICAKVVRSSAILRRA